jgi:hypothetical protein
MSPNPIHLTPGPEALDPEDILWFSYDWCSLPWSPWVPFSATKEEFREIPKEPGLYRIRETGKDFLMYIGETRRPLHQRLHELRIELARAEQMPWSDPHAEAPALWAYQSERPPVSEVESPQDAGPGDSPEAEPAPAPLSGYECSAAPLDASGAGRRGMESFLIYRYRQEYGASPLCNLGRFHPRYRSSGTRNGASRGGKLGEEQKDNPAGGPSLPPLAAAGTPGDANWMGLPWSGREPLVEETCRDAPAGPGLFILSDAASQEILSIGQSGRCADRLIEFSRKPWDGRELQFSVHRVEAAVLPHQIREMETDLIGNFFERYRKAPEYQFRNSR